MYCSWKFVVFTALDPNDGTKERREPYTIVYLDQKESIKKMAN